ncbi:MAG: hypothetical protein CVU53_00870 [Deltaproteobacteria bacterium HGW-Deltaproteobacteria-11]|nr:MAG: hypothetical protein CVU53_00870 [Deltaproteobacteria bacterium HGW-Deltaproteobacteria-11]
MIARFEFPTDSHDFTVFRITYIISSCQHFFHIFFNLFLKIFYPKNLRFLGPNQNRKCPLFSCKERAKSPAH